ncbi:DUF4102 domain-containing protein [Pseudoalteromonas rubra]|uniref:DUF4102 domain-containing protein n=1 Tax=Pseudoalteromonas rubra TaxID=43658 RepID=A0A5S3UV66_9GAMM|nr:site-specific integrase [Pseudoalteromonas rubra]QPB84188.1 DUF4102 domain-containing protein [Pseudoalteromonas rubra]
MKFTDKQIQSLKPRDKRYVLTESIGGYGEGRLQIRVQTTGTKAWRVQYHFNDKRKTISLGNYPNIDLKTARQKHADISRQLLNGVDPQSVKKEEQKEHAAKSAQRTMLQLLEDYQEYLVPRVVPSTIRSTKYMIEKDFVPFIPSDMTPPELTVDDARELLYRIYNRGALKKANFARSVLKNVFKFAVDYDNSPSQYKEPDIYGVKTNVVRDISFDVPNIPGKRWLTEQEVRQVWYADDLPFRTHLYLKLAICMAGQRIQEVYHSNATEYDMKERILTIPESRVKVKNRGDHLVPIGPLAIPVIELLIKHRGASGKLFPHRDKPGESACISNLRLAIRSWCDRHQIPRFTPRDIRRTCKTLMGKAEISKTTRDKLQQHTQSDVSTVHYDRYDYMREKREAMEQWHAYLERILW